MNAEELLKGYRENRTVEEKPVPDNALDMLVGLFVHEYEEMKANFKFHHNMSSHLESLNESLRSSEQESAKKFARLKKLLAPKVSWSNTGEPLGVALFDSEMAKEICEILKIEERKAK